MNNSKTHSHTPSRLEPIGPTFT